jgi:threonine/homoserine/homoserine lactone efflux protein
MNEVIGELLPLALGVAISPVAVIAAILMLLSSRARANGLGFLTGLVLGIIATTVVFILLARLIPESGGGPKPIIGTFKLLLGVLLLVFAVRQWRGRPRDGADPKLPKWMAAIGSMTASRAFTFGLLLSAANPKNLTMSATAGLAIAGGALPLGSIILAAAIFVLVAVSTVAVPVVAYLVSHGRLRSPLDSLRVWLVTNNSVVMAVLFLVLGVVNIGKGIAAY